MDDLFRRAAEIGASLTARGERVAVAESSTGGLISAALLAMPGASAYFLGGAVIYTPRARRVLTTITDAEMKGVRSASEPYAVLLADRIRASHGATWGLAETGAAGPTGNRYGDPAGHTCIAVAGPIARVITLATGRADRHANMRAFAMRALDEFMAAIAAT